MTSNNTCIRVLADINQINQCRNDIRQIDADLKRIASVLDLAGNEVRLKILFLIHNEGEMCPCDLSDVLSMKVPAISQHLRKMKDGGIIKDKKIGQTIFYSLVKENSSAYLPLLDQLIKQNNRIAVE